MNEHMRHMGTYSNRKFGGGLSLDHMRGGNTSSLGNGDGDREHMIVN